MAEIRWVNGKKYRVINGELIRDYSGNQKGHDHGINTGNGKDSPGKEEPSNGNGNGKGNGNGNEQPNPPTKPKKKTKLEKAGDLMDAGAKVAGSMAAAHRQSWQGWQGGSTAVHTPSKNTKESKNEVSNQSDTRTAVRELDADSAAIIRQLEKLDKKNMYG